MAGPGDTFYGRVGIRNFDVGVINLLGPKLLSFTKDGEKFPAYVLDIAELEGQGPDDFDGEIPIMFWPPEGPFEPYLLPCVVIKRGEPALAYQRWEPGGMAYKLPAEGAAPVVVGDQSGYDKYETRPKAVPFDLVYEIELRTRKQWHKVVLWEFALKQLYNRVLEVKDTAGNERTYDFNIDGAGSHADDLVDVADRTLVTTLSVTVIGELDLADPEVYESCRAAGVEFGSMTFLHAIEDC